MLVVFYGADGSGKSTAIMELSKTHQFEVIHFRPDITGGLFSHNRGKKIVVGGRPYVAPPHHMLKSCAKIFYTAFSYAIWYLMNYQKVKSKDHLFIFDRFYLDLLVDQQRMRLAGFHKLIKFLNVFVPTPDKILVFIGDPIEIHKRKPELTEKEIRKLNSSYMQIKGAEIIDTTENSIENVYEKLIRIIF